VAVEAARQLVAAGMEVPLVVVHDATLGVVAEHRRTPQQRARATPTNLAERRPPSEKTAAADIFLRYRRAIAAYAPGRYAGRIAVLRSEETRDKNADLGWSCVSSQVEAHVVPGSHHTSITRHVAATGARLRACLNASAEGIGIASSTISFPQSRS